MGIFDSLRAVFRPRLTYQVSMGPHVSVADMGIDQLYRTQPNLRAVVSYLTDNAAQVPIKVYDRVSDVDRVRVTDSPAALLLEHPNPDMTAYELKRRIYGDLYLYDRHVSILVPDADADSGWRLQPIPARWVVGYEGSNPFAPEAIYVQSDNGRKIAIPAERFIYFHGYDPTDVSRQCSPVEALADVLHEQVESNTFRRQMWRNGGRFNAYIRRPADVEDWTDEAFERFRQSWDESWGGRTASQGGKMPILEDGMEIRTVPFSAHDAEWSEAKRLGRERVGALVARDPRGGDGPELPSRLGGRVGRHDAQMAVVEVQVAEYPALELVRRYVRARACEQQRGGGVAHALAVVLVHPAVDLPRNLRGVVGEIPDDGAEVRLGAVQLRDGHVGDRHALPCYLIAVNPRREVRAQGVQQAHAASFIRSLHRAKRTRWASCCLRRGRLRRSRGRAPS